MIHIFTHTAIYDSKDNCNHLCIIMPHNKQHLAGIGYIVALQQANNFILQDYVSIFHMHSHKSQIQNNTTH